MPVVGQELFRERRRLVVQGAGRGLIVNRGRPDQRDDAREQALRLGRATERNYPRRVCRTTSESAEHPFQQYDSVPFGKMQFRRPMRLILVNSRCRLRGLRRMEFGDIHICGLVPRES